MFENDHILAFLDVLPISQGHTLVIPKRHYVRTSEMPDEIGAMLGATLPKVSRAVSKTSQTTEFNVVNNNGPGAGQVVHHVHYHIVPSPSESERWRKPKSAPYFAMGLGTRYELTEEEGERVAARIRAAIEPTSPGANKL